MDPLISRPAICLIAAATLFAFGAPSAGAQEHLVTYVARECPSYEAITANRARNDIQESLRDLGADTLYTAGEPISAAKEQQGQPTCTPIENWPFVLGRNYETRAVVGPWGALTRVTGAFDTAIATRASVPLLDRNGDPTGTNLPGAVTVPLTAEQARLAATADLWVQGGRVDDPVLDRPFPGRYGFGALRCAIDGLNGDNVEFIAFPQGTRHMLCYAYYVAPPPTSGTIVVRKVVDDPDVTSPQSFTYGGNLSYAPDGKFDLSAASGRPGSATFYRAASGEPWTVREEVPPGWSLTGLSCVSATGASRTVTNPATGEASITLAGGDTVTCTYTDRTAPPTAGLLLSKRTLGGTGAFDFLVDGADEATQTIRTLTPGDPVAGEPLTLAPGRYTVEERLPERTPGGRWILTRAVCDGTASDPRRPIELTLTAGQGSACEFTNRFVPAGALRIRKTTLGGTGTTDFQIRPLAGPPRDLEQQATTTESDRPVLATGDETTNLRLGTYEIVEAGTRGTSDGSDGSWTLVGVTCNGRPVGSAQGRVRVRLTSTEPTVDCTFVNRLRAGPPPEEPDEPNPPITEEELSRGDGPVGALTVTKEVSPRVVPPGEAVRYTVVIENRGPGTALDVVATELLPARSTLGRLRTTRGTCTRARPARCSIGRLAAGQRATITTTLTANRAGRHTNRVGVVTSTGDPELTNNVAAATVTVRRPSTPRFTG